MGDEVEKLRAELRETKEELASLYTVFYARIPPNPTAEALAAEFADKELRVLVTQNGVLINDYCEITHKYTEKTKSQKVSALMFLEQMRIRVWLTTPCTRWKRCWR